MSSYLHDLPSAAALAPAIAPAAFTATANGSAVAALAGDGPEFALVQIGTPTGTGASATVSIEESSDQSTWTAIAGATTGAKTAAAAVALPYLRSKAYVRAKVTIAGTSPSVPVAVALGQQKKLW